jgi:hypothetical protein
MRGIRSTRPAWRVLLPLMLAIMLGSTACDDKKRFSPTSPTPTGPAVQAITVTGGTTLQRPGDEVQLTATARFSDGTTRDISSEASWSVDYTEIVSVARGGLLTARGYGQCNVTVSYASVSARVPVRVMLEGMFALSGRISDESGLPLWPARVSIALSALSATTNRQGLYTLPGRGDIEVRAEMDGFEALVKRVTVVGDATLDFQLRLSTGGFGGVYRLTFTAAASCELPVEARRRTYLVRLVETPSGAVSVIVISPEMVAWGDAGFVGRRDGSRLHFDITDDFSNDYPFVELLDPGRELAYSGTATGEVVGDTFVVTFSGSITVRQRSGATLARCEAANHRLEFTR